ncbi:MAG: flavodoxin-dependent (E)-4-hydroxy-3-methylbut-2-enyl-diphosphate synthase [Desulfatibacillaceae bacterium]
MEITRRHTRPVVVGGLLIGAGEPVAVQSMCNTDTRDVEATADQICRLAAAGCELVRVAVPDMEAARAIADIKARIAMPLVADIHFDHRLAIAAAEAGADGLRLNPGNIGSRQRVEKVIRVAAERDLAVRVGVNAGSLEKELVAEHGGPTAAAMVVSALRHVEAIRAMGFDNLKVSLKASDIFRTVEAHRLFAKKSDTPLHVGVTEAGSRYAGVVKSSIGIGMVLAEGLGDTIRVSLTGDPVVEVRVAWHILSALRLRQRGPEIVSCPTCGRCEIDLPAVVDAVEEGLDGVTASMQIAIMGCVVNGPGEAREADVGVAGGRGQAILFKKGEVVARIPESRLAEVLIEEARALAREREEKDPQREIDRNRTI